MDTPRLYGDLSWVWPLLSPHSAYPEEAALLTGCFREHGVPPGGTLLHLGCGGGSLDYHLAQGFSVTGVDRSRAMLDRAAALNPGVEYIVGDMREVALSRTFDGVLLYDAHAYLTAPDELAAVYATEARHLRPGGVFVSTPEELRERFVQHGVQSTTSHAPDGSAIVTTIEDTKGSTKSRTPGIAPPNTSSTTICWPSPGISRASGERSSPDIIPTIAGIIGTNISSDT